MCPSCETAKAPDQFYFRSGKPAGYCKRCAKEKERARHRLQVVANFGVAELERRDALRELRSATSESESVCTRCFSIKPKKEFYGKLGSLDALCIPCRRQYDKERCASTPRARLATLVCAARNRAKKEKRAFSLTTDELLGLWASQEGRCWYTGIPLVYDGLRTPEALSLDRVDSRQGYFVENVVLCCRRVNEMKREMSLKDLQRWCSLILAGAKEDSRE